MVVKGLMRRCIARERHSIYALFHYFSTTALFAEAMKREDVDVCVFARNLRKIIMKWDIMRAGIVVANGLIDLVRRPFVCRELASEYAV